MTPEELKALEDKVGGHARLVTMIQQRLKDLGGGADPLVETAADDLVDVALEEIAAGKVRARPERERRRERKRPPREGKPKGQGGGKPRRRGGRRNRSGRRRR